MAIALLKTDCVTLANKYVTSKTEKRKLQLENDLKVEGKKMYDKYVLPETVKHLDAIYATNPSLLSKSQRVLFCGQVGYKTISIKFGEPMYIISNNNSLQISQDDFEKLYALQGKIDAHNKEVKLAIENLETLLYSIKRIDKIVAEIPDIEPFLVELGLDEKSKSKNLPCLQTKNILENIKNIS